MTIEQLVTDKAIKMVFTNTRFGIPARQVIADTLKTIKEGNKPGATAGICCVELGLLIMPAYRQYELSITGKKYLELLKETENENRK